MRVEISSKIKSSCHLQRALLPKRPKSILAISTHPFRFTLTWDVFPLLYHPNFPPFFFLATFQPILFPTTRAYKLLAIEHMSFRIHNVRAYNFPSLNRMCS